MREEIISFYNRYGLDVGKLTRRSPRKYTKEQIIAAMVEAYELDKQGKKVKPIKLARFIWEIAGDLDTKRLIKEYDTERENELKDVIEFWEKKHNNVKTILITYVLISIIMTIYVIFFIKGY